MKIDTDSLKLKSVKGEDYLLCPLRIRYPSDEAKIVESKALLNLVSELVLGELNNPNVPASNLALYSRTEKGFKPLISWSLCGIYLFFRRQRKTKGHTFIKSFIYAGFFQLVVMLMFNALVAIPQEQVLKASLDKYLPEGNSKAHDSFAEFIANLNLNH